jgi:polyisoprenoid-binding protein YceI
MKASKIAALFVLLVTIGTVQAQNWKISENHNIAFSNKDVSGVFKEISGSIIFDATKLSSLNLSVQEMVFRTNMRKVKNGLTLINSLILNLFLQKLKKQILVIKQLEN